MEKIKVYQKPTCTTSKKAMKALEEKGMDFEKIDYYKQPFSKTKLKKLIRQMDKKLQDLLRKRAKEYKEFDFKNKNYKADEIIELMVKYPDLIERPIIEKGDKAILGRPPEKALEILN